MDEVEGEGRDLRCGCHPAGEIGFERWLVVVAGYLGLACYFDHCIIAELGGEEGLGAIEKAFDGGTPFGVAVRLDETLALTVL